MMCGRFVPVDLSEDCRLVVERFRLPPEQAVREDGDLSGKCQFRTRHQTNCHIGIIERSEAAGPGAEVTRHQLVADLCGSRMYALEAKVTHFWDSLLVGSPQPRETLAQKIGFGDVRPIRLDRCSIVDRSAVFK